jgi:hypothetical protein
MALRIPRGLRGTFLPKSCAKYLLQLGDRQLQIERGLQRLATQLAQAALRLDEAEDGRPAGAIAFLRQRLQIGDSRDQAALERLDLPALGLDARDDTGD